MPPASTLPHLVYCIDLPDESSILYTVAGGIAFCGLLLVCVMWDYLSWPKAE